MIPKRVFDAIEYLPREANHYVRNLARLKAYDKDPKFREIEDRRHEFGTVLWFGPGLGIEDWMYQQQKIEDLTPSLHYWQKLVTLSRRPRILEGEGRRAWQRVKKGYDDWAVYDFRSWHATHVVKALAEFKNDLHTHPADRSPQQWEQDLNDLIDKFKVISSPEFADDQQMVDEAMRAMAKVYLHLWN